jgi:chloramphenicol 3-O-phosphotransferase
MSDPADPRARAIVLITGIQAAGKSTVAQALAERLPRSVHLRGDLFRRLIVNGRADMTPRPTAAPPHNGVPPTPPTPPPHSDVPPTPPTAPPPSGLTPTPPADEAVAQLRLRHRLTAQTADAYFEAGFTVVAQDVILGEHLPATVSLIRNRPLLLVVLCPSPTAVAAREAARPKSAYSAWTVEALDTELRARTPRIGLWLDTSHQSAADTVDEIVARAWIEAAV